MTMFSMHLSLYQQVSSVYDVLCSCNIKTSLNKSKIIVRSSIFLETNNQTFLSFFLSSSQPYLVKLNATFCQASRSSKKKKSAVTFTIVLWISIKFCMRAKDFLLQIIHREAEVFINTAPVVFLNHLLLWPTDI